jgi:hypothetical protein
MIQVEPKHEVSHVESHTCPPDVAGCPAVLEMGSIEAAEVRGLPEL